MSNVITAPITVVEQIITAPITLGISPNAPGAAIIVKEILTSALDGNFDFEVVHGLDIASLPPYSVTDGDGNGLLVQVQRIDSNTLKVRFGRAITETHYFSYMGV